MSNTVLAVVGFCMSAGALAATQTLPAESEPEARGLAIAQAADARNRGFGQSVTRLDMVLANAQGRTRTRQLTWKILEGPDGDRSLVVFHEPRDIEGTALLSYSRPSADDDQWLYLPALKRVKRIASGNRAGSFVGSEFSYEDLLPERVEDFDHRWLRDEACGEWQCYVLERRPRYADSGYVRQLLWLDQAEFRLVKINYYDLEDRLLKNLVADDYRLYLNRNWRAHTLLMENHVTRKLTRLTFGEYNFRTRLSERDFDPSALRRQR